MRVTEARARPRQRIDHDYREDLIALDARVPLPYVVREEMGPRVARWAARYTPAARVEAFGGHMMFWERTGATYGLVATRGFRRCPVGTVV